MKKLLLAITLFISLTYSQDYNIQKFGVGYSGAIPEIPIGVTAGLYLPGKVSFYMSYKFDTNGVDESLLYENINYHKASVTLGDRFVENRYKDQYISVGATYNVTDNIYLYIGGSYTARTNYAQFYDRFGILGSGGDYFIYGKDGIEELIGLNAGFTYFLDFAQENTFYLSIGGNLNPTFIEVGIGYAFPSPYKY